MPRRQVPVKRGVVHRTKADFYGNFVAVAVSHPAVIHKSDPLINVQAEL